MKQPTRQMCKVASVIAMLALTPVHGQDNSIEAEKETFVIRGKLLDSAKKPVTEKGVYLLLVKTDEAGSLTSVTQLRTGADTDQSGVFTITVSRSQLPPKQQYSLWVGPKESDLGNNMPFPSPLRRGGSMLVLQYEGEPSEIDVGDIVLEIE